MSHGGLWVLLILFLNEAVVLVESAVFRSNAALREKSLAHHQGLHADSLNNKAVPDTKRHAGTDCNEALNVTRSAHATAIDKGQFLSELYLKGGTKFQEALRIALDVRERCTKRNIEAAQEIKDFDLKISKADSDDKEEHPLSGHSTLGKWKHERENTQAEITFYEQIKSNGGIVASRSQRGLDEVKALREKAKVADDLQPLQVELNQLIDDADNVFKDALELWQHWQDSSKPQDCGIPPQAEHSLHMCTSGDTKFKPKCQIICAEGYDGEGTANTLRCNKQGKIGRRLYGEWMGMATCAGRMCGLPSPLDNAQAVTQQVRFPDVGTYRCHRGFVSPLGQAIFTVPCGKTGNFETNASHSCIAVTCGSAPHLANTAPVKGEFRFTDVATYSCLKGYTIDELPGGLQQFSISCQATGQFTEAIGCKPVRCGAIPQFANTKVALPDSKKPDVNKQAEIRFGDEVSFACEPGFSLDTSPKGSKAFTLKCSSDGGYSVPGIDQSKPIPKCQPICAGTPPAVPHGTFKSHNLCFGDKVVVTADTGYSTTGKLEETTFTITLGTDGSFVGMKKLLPVECGKPPTVSKAAVTFGKSAATYTDLLAYRCEKGYSIDATDASSSSEFTIQCTDTGDFSLIPGKGECVNIDDCHGHTCGPHGSCVDRLMNYTCDCEDGYKAEMDERGEIHCGNVDDCGPEACGVGKCVDLVNDYKCNCPDGYTEVFEAHGNRSDKTCMPVSCGGPPVIDHAYTVPADDQTEKSVYGKLVTYQCINGHTISGQVGGKVNFQVKCQATKKFSKAEECNPITCDKPPELKNAAVHSTKATFQQGIEVKCDAGHSIDGTASGDSNFTITCQATGKFSIAEECKPVSCGAPTDIPNSFFNSKHLVFKEEVEYTCLDGFTVDGTKDGKTKFKVTCEEDGKLSSGQKCLPKVCGVPLPKEVKWAAVKDEGHVHYPMNTQVLCADGHTLDGSPTGNASFVVRCLSTGEFESYNTNQCQPVRCGMAPKMPNAVLVNVEDDHGTSLGKNHTLAYHHHARYECKVGFTAGGEHDAPTYFDVECGSAGHFNPPSEDMLCKNVNDCEGHTCGPKGICVDLIGPSPAYTCNCSEGYEMQVDDKGEKHCGNTDDCKGVDCGKGVCVDLIGDFTCQCPTGYYIGLDDDDRKTCVPAKCASAAPPLPNGKLLSMHKGEVHFPTTLRYECDEGYSTDGSVTKEKRKFQTQCRADGQMHGMISCGKISCGTAEVYPSTKLVKPAGTEHSLSYKETAEYECEDGYTIKGKPNGSTKFVVNCPADGHLTPPEICEPVQCGEAPHFAHSHIALSGVVMYGMTVKYECEPGFTLDSTADGNMEFTVMCLKNGEFSKVDSTSPCQPIYTLLPVIGNARLVQYAGGQVANQSIQRARFPNGVEYHCNPGFTVSGSPAAPSSILARVTSSGFFSPGLPERCSQIMFTIRGTVKDARNGQMLGGVTVRIEGSNVTAEANTGYFTFPAVPARYAMGTRGIQVPGNITIRYQKRGYIDSVKTFVLADNIASGGLADVAMSPVMTSDQWRVVLKWGETPRDLDSYIKWGTHKVSYTNLQQNGDYMSAQLEHDDTTGFGPETVHVSNVGKCKGNDFYCDLRYYVNDYSRTGKMLDELCDVSLYTGSRIAGSWHIKDCPKAVSKDGLWWHVFTLDGRTNKLKWTCLDGASPDPESVDFLIKQPNNTTKGVSTQNRLRSTRV